MKSFLTNAPFDLAFIALLWFGMIGGVAWAANLAVFVTWLFVLTGCFLLVPSIRAILKVQMENKDKWPRSPFFKAWDFGTDVVMVLLVAAGGYIFLALLFGFASVLKHGVSDELDKEAREEQDAE